MSQVTRVTSGRRRSTISLEKQQLIVCIIPLHHWPQLASADSSHSKRLHCLFVSHQSSSAEKQLHLIYFGLLFN